MGSRVLPLCMGLALLCALAAAGCARPSDLTSSLRAEGCVARVFPNGVGAAYMRIVNSGGGADTLQGAESPWAARVELHDVVRDGDVVTMREQVDGVRVGPHSTLLLEPGHRHLMMQQVELEPKARSLPLILHFVRAGSLEVTADIANPRETFD